MASKRVLNIEARLDELLAAEEPALIRWLQRTWKVQTADITDVELRAAIVAGELPTDWAARFQERYAEFINERMVPRWEKGADEGVAAVAVGVTALGIEHDFSMLEGRIKQWVEQRGGELVTGLTARQMQALRSVLTYHTVTAPMAEKELMKLLRPLVGLTPGQAEAVRKQREALIESGLKVSKVERIVQRTAARYRTIRAKRIARTELAFAHNKGTQAAVEDVAASGAFDGPVEKVWVTQEDERVCVVCGPLDGVTVGLSGEFEVPRRGMANVEVPPAHPSCRCLLKYVT